MNATSIVDPLIDWFAIHARPLPWRAGATTAWGVLLSEVMSHQTPVSRVAPLWHEWVDRWPTPADLAVADGADVIRAWAHLGYPRRALALRDAARIITEQHAGQVPDTEAQLLALPGVGPYTAAAVLAFAFGQRSVVLDTNIRRVLVRTRDAIALPTASTSAAERAGAGAIVPAEPARAALWNAAIMEFGALVCTARAPRCDACPIAVACAWRAAGYPDNAPTRRIQTWHGSDRQVRGAIMAFARRAEISHPDLLDQLGPGRDPAQVTRALEGLLADGLLTREAGRYCLPA